MAIRTWCIGSLPSDNPVYQKQQEGMLQAMQKAGVPAE
jgi:hypothetical protein